MTRSYDIRPCGMGDVKDLCARFHGYHGAGSVAVYAFGVYEDGAIVAAYAWQPPPLGSAKKVCPQAPHGVLLASAGHLCRRGRRAHWIRVHMGAPDPDRSVRDVHLRLATVVRILAPCRSANSAM